MVGSDYYPSTDTDASETTDATNAAIDAEITAARPQDSWLQKLAKLIANQGQPQQQGQPTNGQNRKDTFIGRLFGGGR